MGGIGEIFKRRGVPVWLAGINTLLFLVVSLSFIAVKTGMLQGAGIAWQLELPASYVAWLHRPWTLLTYMFVHENFLHLLFNMLWLLWFGDLFMRVGTGRKLLGLYLCGGIAGGLLYLFLAPVLHTLYAPGALLLGASSAVLAIMTATATLMPDYTLHLFFIGDVKLKWIAVAMIILAFIGLGGGNAGGEIAHIGGVIYGLAYGFFHKKIVGGQRAATRKVPRRKNPFKGFSPDISHRSVVKIPAHNAEERERENLRRLDTLLDKIRVSGYNSLTRAEREELDNLSRKITR